MKNLKTINLLKIYQILIVLIKMKIQIKMVTEIRLKNINRNH
jgi:hypothetical protein